MNFYHPQTHVNRNRRCLRQLVLLAPSESAIPLSFTNVHNDFNRYEQLLGEMQLLRGAVYLDDGAIQIHELSDQRHRLDVDLKSWHLLVLDSMGRVCGCARYREYPAETGFEQLSVSRSALARCSEWGDPLRSSVDAELGISRDLSLPYVELGGWALMKQVRHTSEALRLALSTYGLAQALGGGIGISTATFRNNSSTILRKLGGQPLEHKRRHIPSYFDPQYGCEMEVLRFRSWSPNVRYLPWIADIRRELRNVPIVTNGAFDSAWTSRRTRDAHRRHTSTVSSENNRSYLV